MLELSGLVPTGTLSELAPELKASLQAGSIEIVLGYLDEHYDSRSSRRQSRLIWHAACFITDASMDSGEMHRAVPCAGAHIA